MIKNKRDHGNKKNSAQLKKSMSTHNKNLKSQEIEEITLLEVELNWFLGNWHVLTKITEESITKLKDRAAIALFISSAYRNLNLKSQADIFFQKSLEWHASKQLIMSILIADAHNHLGCAACVMGIFQKAVHHFRKATSLNGTTSNITFASIRSTKEMIRLMLFLPALKNINSIGINENINTITLLDSNYYEIIKNDISELRETLKQKIDSHLYPEINNRKINIKTKHDYCIIIAGMRHSGSTALFNIIRLLLKENDINYLGCYSEHGDCILNISQKTNNIRLIKTHEFRDDVINLADFIFTTRRDLRDTVASAKRRQFPLMKNLGGAVEYAKYNRSLHSLWAGNSNYEFIYENFIKSPLQVINEILTLMGYKEDNLSKKILSGILFLPTDNYKETLLSSSHITDPKRILSFYDSLTNQEINTINSHHQDWLNLYNYPIQNPWDL